MGIDIGGTFTDFVLQKESELVIEKTLSTPEDRSEAVMTGLGAGTTGGTTGVGAGRDGMAHAGSSTVLHSLSLIA